MKIISRPPQSGKTTDLIKACAAANAEIPPNVRGKHYIVVANRMQAEHVSRLAHELGIDVPFPLVPGEQIGKYVLGLFVDNVEHVLFMMLGRRVLTVTTTGDRAAMAAEAKPTGREGRTMTDPLSADLAQVLASLYRAGKIASPWLPGMLVDFVPGQRETHPLSASSYPRRITSRSDIPRFIGHRDGRIVVGPVVDDPATRGCLLALVREAHGDPSIGIVGDGEKFSVIVCPVNCRPIVHGFDDLTYIGSGPTEAHALLAALRAALPTETS